jgi:tetratricopeptide (TPR) repeat protein
MDNKLKIENFCELNNKRFKVYYNYLNNAENLNKFMIYLKIIKHKDFHKRLLKLININKNAILDNCKNMDILISFYKQNNLINKSEIGKFFSFYEKEYKKISRSTIKKGSKLDLSILKMFLKIINYERFIETLKEILYIFSDYRACIYFMTPSINFENYQHTKKEIVKDIVLKFRCNINTLNQIISHIYVGYKNRWGSGYYATAIAMFDTLMILKKYFKNVLSMLKIKFECHKKTKDIIKKICENYHKKKMFESEIDNMINPKKINNVSQFIINMKRLGYDMWFVIPLVFDSIYGKYKLNGLCKPLIWGTDKIYLQNMNNELGFMCFKLVEDGYISNIHIFNRFND